MSRQSGCKSAQAIASELKAFPHPTSQLHRSIRKRLLELQTSSRSLEQLFLARRRERARVDTDFAARASRTAENGLVAARAGHEKSLALGSPELVAVTAPLLEFADNHVKLVQKQIAKFAEMTQAADAMDASLGGWLDNLVTQSARALRDNASLDRALAVASGGLILAGATGGASLAVAAAVASVALLARDIQAKLTKAGSGSDRDRHIAREEAAHELLQVVANPCAEWQLILSVRNQQGIP